MAELAKFTLNDGEFFVAEVDDTTSSGRTMRGGLVATGLFAGSNESFQAALSQVKNAAEAVVDRLRSLAKPADEVTLEFGVKLNAETGAIIAKASTDAHFVVTLRWRSADTLKT